MSPVHGDTCATHCARPGPSTALTLHVSHYFHGPVCPQSPSAGTQPHPHKQVTHLSQQCPGPALALSLPAVTHHTQPGEAAQGWQQSSDRSTAELPVQPRARVTCHGHRAGTARPGQTPESPGQGQRASQRNREWKRTDTRKPTVPTPRDTQLFDHHLPHPPTRLARKAS